MSPASFPGARPPSLLPRTGASPPAPDDPDREAWNQMMQERAQARQASDDFEHKYWWLSLPALAPVGVAATLEGVGAIASPFMRPALPDGPLSFPNKEWRFYAGNNRYAQAGMRAHADFKAKVDAKPGWRPQPTARGPNGEALRPDAATKGDKFYVELKPDTPSGRKAGAAQAARYRRLTKTPTRPTYYNPDDYR